MTWSCNSKEAIEHEKSCKDTWNCNICAAILAASVAMEEYGTEVIEEPEDHPLLNYAVEKFGGEVE